MCEVDEFESALKYALECTGNHGLSPKPEQVTAIRAVYDKKDVFVWLPTGFGKSLCYETIPFIFDWKLRRVDSRSLVLVVSPLVALMIDQVKSLRKRNVKAAIISGGAGGVDKQLLATENDLARCSLLYGAPEAILTPRWRDSLEKEPLNSRVVAVVIDEAHCVSSWLVP